MKGLVGKRAIVTGGSSGIGQAIAVRPGDAVLFHLSWIAWWPMRAAKRAR